MKLLIAFVALLVPIAADAQDHVGLTFSAGGIFGADPPPAEDFAEPFYALTIQRVIKTYFVVEGDFAYWAHIARNESGPHTLSGPNGVLGTVQGTTVINDEKDLNLGVNLLARSTGKVRVFGGAGVGVVMRALTYSQESVGCSPGLDPRACSKYENSRGQGPLPLFRVLGGVEVPVANRVAIIGTTRAEVVTWEGRANFLVATLGVRFAF